VKSAGIGSAPAAGPVTPAVGPVPGPATCDGVDGDADPDKVTTAVTDALRNAYSFDARAFGQSVTIDEVYATIQNVPGVAAADIDQLYRSDTGPAPSEPQPRLLAALPDIKNGSVTAAELLTLSDAPLDFGVMS